MRTALRWAGLWGLAGALLGTLSLTGGGVGHLAGWMAPVVLGGVLGVMGGAGGVLFGLWSVSRRGGPAYRALAGAVCGALGVVAVGAIPGVGIALGGGWFLPLGVGMGLVSGLASSSS